MDEIEQLLQPTKGPVKTYSKLLEEGVQHAGGLALLASAETDSPSPSTEALLLPSKPGTSE